MRKHKMLKIWVLNSKEEFINYYFFNEKWAFRKTAFSNHPYFADNNNKMTHQLHFLQVCPVICPARQRRTTRMCRPSEVSARACRECSGIGRQRDRKGMERSRYESRHFKVLQYWAEKNEQNEQTKIHLMNQKKNTKTKQKKSYSFSVDATALICKHFKVSFKQGVPHFTDLVLSDGLENQCASHLLLQATTASVSTDRGSTISACFQLSYKAAERSRSLWSIPSTTRRPRIFPED